MRTASTARAACGTGRGAPKRVAARFSSHAATARNDRKPRCSYNTRGDLDPFTLIEYGDYECVDDESLLGHAAVIGLDVQRMAHDLALNGQRYEGPRDAMSIIAAIRTALVLNPPPGRVHDR